MQLFLIRRCVNIVLAILVFEEFVNLFLELLKGILVLLLGNGLEAVYHGDMRSFLGLFRHDVVCLTQGLSRLEPDGGG